MVRPRDANSPPLHRAMSRSSTRGAPALAAAAAELALDALEPAQHLGRLEIAFDQRDRIGEIASRAGHGRVEDDRRGVEQAELLIEPRDRGLDDLGGRPKRPCGRFEPIAMA